GRDPRLDFLAAEGTADIADRPRHAARAQLVLVWRDDHEDVVADFEGHVRARGRVRTGRPSEPLLVRKLRAGAQLRLAVLDDALGARLLELLLVLAVRFEHVAAIEGERATIHRP